MKRRLVFVSMFILGLLGVAFAQDVTGIPSLDPSKLGADVFALGGAVLFSVQFIKRQFERRGTPLAPAVTLALTFGLAEVISAGLFYARFGAKFGELPPPWSWVVFGGLAAAVAAGFRDFVVALVERRALASTLIVSPGALDMSVGMTSGGNVTPGKTGFVKLEGHQ
ncbi:hypothetical protein [Deinococcus yavapaiensis]|uniref:Uncharacterized protein n=1 Tax=Deinococcus yavapaiensis KR-236 TaxID=694435 RepID=A0A318S7Q2_9DEIO|nr:hypothetical protein [Deinococcus yavapaiensis]PYE51061.1 hypothetical protein DES52_116128 [Deinococcus yavapaiensis KR-236]